MFAACSPKYSCRRLSGDMQTIEVIKVILSYLLGSVVGGLVVGRLRGGVDIRRLGSGNAGGTNALRTQGKAFAFWVMLIDIGKGWMATRVVAPFHSTEPHGWLAAACGIAVILGHVYPLWYGFRGGKGVATLVGAALGLDLWLLLPMLATWLAAVILFGFVGLGSSAWGAGSCGGAGGPWVPRGAARDLRCVECRPDCIHASVSALSAHACGYRAARAPVVDAWATARERVIGRRKAIDRPCFCRVVGWAVPLGRGSCTGSRRKPERCLESREVFVRSGRHFARCTQPRLSVGEIE